MISSHSINQFLHPEETPAIRRSLEQYSRNKDLGIYSMENVVRLACGRLSSVILLRKPCKAAEVMPYEMMVTSDGGEGKQNKYTASTPTLPEIDHTICGHRMDK